MPSKLIGPPIIRWKEKKEQKHHYLLYQTEHHSHQLIIIIPILSSHYDIIRNFHNMQQLVMFNSERVHSN